MSGHPLRVTLNGRPLEHVVASHVTLLRWLREQAGALEVKYGCGEGVCGTCAVLVDGRAVNSCLLLAVQVDGGTVTTSRGLAPGTVGGRLQRAFLEHGAVQCGFCTPGMLVTAVEIVEQGEAGDRQALRDALHGNLCRCTGYQAVVDAVDEVRRERSAGSP